MKILRFITLLLAGMSVATSLQADVLFVKPGEWTPFLERIDPKEFLILENKLSESLSDTNDLVIYDTYYYPTAFSFALSRKTGESYRLKISKPSHVGSSHTTIPLPSDVAERLIFVMEFALTNQVYAPTGKAIQVEASTGKKPEEDESYVWVNLRLDSKRTISGMVRRGNRNQRCLMGQGLESGSAFRELLYRMSELSPEAPKYYFGGENTFGYSQFFMLDLAISNLRLSYPTKR